MSSQVVELASKTPTSQYFSKLKKQENWRFVPVARLAKFEAYLDAPKSKDVSLATLRDNVDNYTETNIERNIASLETIRIVFVNGQPENLESLKTLTTDGLSIEIGHADHVTRDSGPLLLADSDQHPFANSAKSSAEHALKITVSANAEITTPIEIIWLNQGVENTDEFFHEALYVDVQQSASVTIIERFVGEGENTSLGNSLTEVNLAENAKAQHYRLIETKNHAMHVGGVHSTLGRDANYNGFIFAKGSRLVREDHVVNHAVKGSHCDLNGVYLPSEDQFVDFHTTIEHAVPHCTTDEVFRGIVGGKAKAVFNGRIHIHPDAQKTLATLSNKNLLTSSKAEVNTKPELEIYADDVQCAHGATVAELASESLNYFKSRGINETQARVMLSFGFINELLNGLPHQEIAEYLRPILAELFEEHADENG